MTKVNETPNLLSLHPRDLTDEEFSVYQLEFEKVLGDPLCKNIALSGPYGAGKSSVIEKAKKKRQSSGEKWITVSLATFNRTDVKEPSASELDQDDIEAEILRQLVHKIGTSKAPKSRFRKLGDRSRTVDTIATAVALAFAILTAYLISVSADLLSLQPSCLEGGAFAVWLIIAGIALFRLIRSDAISRAVRKVRIFDAELEITSSDSASPYERCADEIVYLLNASEIDAVVFEDLDRFNSIGIFEKMRRLNALANDSRCTDNKSDEATKPLRFFYLMRDGLFENPHDRTKFFDYVIPVVPYIDPNNALDIMRSALSGVGLSVDERFLYQLSSYIDDPRIINDIADEAFHYRSTLFKERSFGDGDSERLVALLAYKALFPRDFELLQVGRGYLHEILHGKRRLISELEQGDADQRAELSRELDGIENQLKVTEDELICMFGASRMRNVSQYFNENDLMRYSNPHSFLEAARKNGSAARELKSLIDTLEKNDQYVARLQEIRGDAIRRSEVVRAKLRGLEAKTETLSAMTIKQLIDDSPNADALFEFKRSDIDREEDFDELSMEDVTNSPFFPMLRFLVSSGYIDESYRRYISNFYSDSLCAEDDDFLSTIMQARSVDLTYKPKSPDEIVRRMSREEFSRAGIRNPWLVSSLFDSGDKRKVDAFMSSVRRIGGLQYLAEFIASDQCNPKVFRWMFKFFDNPVSGLLGDEEISIDNKRCFCKRYLSNAMEFPLTEKDSTAFTTFANSDSRFLEEDTRFDDAAIEKGVLGIGYRAEAIDFSRASSALLESVYDNRLFMPTPSIVEKYLNLKHGINGSMDRGTLVSDPLKLLGSPLRDVVLENLDYFVSRVVRETDVPLEDDPKCIAIVLNDKEIQATTGKLYIDSLADVEIEDVSQIESADYRSMLLAAQLVTCNEDNVISYFKQSNNSISEDLAELIEAKGAPSGLNAAKCAESNVDETEIVGSLMECETISIPNKRVILNGCGFTYSFFDIEKLDDETTREMIEVGVMEMNADMLDEFRLHKSDLTINFILSNVRGFLALVGFGSSDDPKRTIEETEVLGLLASNIDTQTKLDVLSCFDGALRLDNAYEDAVNDAILVQHFDQSDMVNLSSYYAKAAGAYKGHIAETASAHSDTIIAEKIDLGWSLLCESLQYMKTNREQAMRLLEMFCSQYGSKRDRDDVKRCFESAGLKEYAKLIGGSQSMIFASSADDAMLSALSVLGMCGKVSSDVNSEGLRKVYPKGHTRTK